MLEQISVNVVGAAGTHFLTTHSLKENPHHKPKGLVLYVVGPREAEASLREQARRHAEGKGISQLINWEGPQTLQS